MVQSVLLIECTYNLLYNWSILPWLSMGSFNPVIILGLENGFGILVQNYQHLLNPSTERSGSVRCLIWVQCLSCCSLLNSWEAVEHSHCLRLSATVCPACSEPGSIWLASVRLSDRESACWQESGTTFSPRGLFVTVTLSVDAPCGGWANSKSSKISLTKYPYMDIVMILLGWLLVLS